MVGLRSWRSLLAGVGMMVLAIGLVPEAGSQTVTGGAPADPGVQALVSAGCTLCHEGAGLPTPARVDACSGCHIWIRRMSADPSTRAKAMAVFPKWERYEKNLHTYFQVPSLDAAAARLDPGWVVRYLRDPHDLRPALPETMPRFQLDTPTLTAVAGWFAARTVPVAAGPPVDAARAAEGRRLFEERCVACHAFGARHTAALNPAAPDLAHTPGRMDPDHARAWILDPAAVSPAATMPAMGLTPDQATAVRDYLYTTDPAAPEAGAADVVHFVAAASTSGPPPASPTWADVEERVFGRICVHCHMDPAQNDGRRGPGNAGGFGWPATGIELQTWEGVVANRDAILTSLDRRVAEARRDALVPGVAPAALTSAGRPGMPLGLPPLAAEDLAMVKRWFAAGAPR